MAKETIVSNCQECPFVIKDDYDYIGCKLNHEIGEWIMPKDKVHDDCPLKDSEVTVKLKS
jgi:hypothetical protein